MVACELHPPRLSAKEVVLVAPNEESTFDTKWVLQRSMMHRKSSAFQRELWWPTMVDSDNGYKIFYYSVRETQPSACQRDKVTMANSELTTQ